MPETTWIKRTLAGALITAIGGAITVYRSDHADIINRLTALEISQARLLQKSTDHEYRHSTPFFGDRAP